MFLDSCFVNSSLNIFSHNKWVINEADKDDSFRVNVNPLGKVCGQDVSDELHLNLQNSCKQKYTSQFLSQPLSLCCREAFYVLPLLTTCSISSLPPVVIFSRPIALATCCSPVFTMCNSLNHISRLHWQRMSWQPHSAQYLTSIQQWHDFFMSMNFCTEQDKIPLTTLKFAMTTTEHANAAASFNPH